MFFTQHEQLLAERFHQIKRHSGSHHPSFSRLKLELPEVEVKVDACFLSNPYATDLFMDYLQEDVLDAGELRTVLERYPAQNAVLARVLGKGLNLDPARIFLGSGASEIIHAIYHNFVRQKVVVVIPTFSPYYEFARPDVTTVYFPLLKENDFNFDMVAFLELVKREQPDTVVIINPNNPNGGYYSFGDMRYLLEEMKSVETIILDESFIHFSYEDDSLQYRSFSDHSEKYDNLIVVKSLSKDFGIAGIRLGFALMAPKRVTALLKHGYLWNISGLGEYFVDLYSRKIFQQRYEVVRHQYLKDTRQFFNNMSSIDGLKTYPSKANFVLVELTNGMSANDLAVIMMIKSGVYIRDCGDKIGLEGEFVRVAARTAEENACIITGLQKAINS